MNLACLSVPAEIFKAYDIRGIVGRTLTPKSSKLIGRAIGSEARARGQTAHRDRPRRPAVRAGAERGAGARPSAERRRRDRHRRWPRRCCTSPRYHLDTQLRRDGHRQPQSARVQRPEDGGRRRDAGRRDAIQALRQRIERGDLATGSGSYIAGDIAEAYSPRITADVKLARPMKIVVDCGNGVAGAFAPELFRAARLRSERALLRSRRHFPEPSSRSRRSRRTCAT